MLRLILVLTLLAPLALHAQAGPPPMGPPPTEASQFDYLIGEWRFVATSRDPAGPGRFGAVLEFALTFDPDLYATYYTLATVQERSGRRSAALSNMEKALFACDELAGLITATALVKPSKSLAEVDARSIRKKMKDKAFARSVSREDIMKGAQELGVELDEHIAFCIEAMKGIAKELGLDGAKLAG